MQRLSVQQTRAVLEKLEIDRSLSRALGFADPARDLRYEFHAHAKHQLIFPRHGTLTVETAEHLHICSPPAGMWIAARVRHATTIGAGAICSLYFPARWSARTGVREMLLSPVLREMASTAALGLEGPAAFRERFFLVIAELCARAPEARRPAPLLCPHSERLRGIVGRLLETLAEATVRSLARGAGMSERSLRRLFQEELGIGVERYLQQARLIKACRRLIEDRRCSIAQVALEVGYGNQSAFAAAFRREVGCTPRVFRAEGR